MRIALARDARDAGPQVHSEAVIKSLCCVFRVIRIAVLHPVVHQGSAPESHGTEQGLIVSRTELFRESVHFAQRMARFRIQLCLYKWPVTYRHPSYNNAMADGRTISQFGRAQWEVLWAVRVLLSIATGVEASAFAFL